MNTKFQKSLFAPLWRIYTILVVLSLLLSIIGVSPVRAETTCTDVSLEALEDTYLRQSQATRNYGVTTTISHSPNTSYRQNSLFRWDLTSIPSAATITAASLTFNVTEGSAYDFNLYSMRQSWVEGTSNDVASTTSANWNTYNGSTNWGTNGAMNTSSDRYDTDLWDATASTFGATGSVTIPLNSSGVGTVQRWVTTASSNYGLTAQYIGTGTTSDYWIVSSSEATTVANRLKLNVTYCATIGPTITTSGTLSAFTSQPGVASTEQSYTVSGSSLTDNIVITAPAAFQISTASGSGFGSTVTLTPTSGSVPSTTIYVRLYSTTEGTFNGNITHTSTDASEVDLAVSGTASNCTTANLTAAEDTYMSANDVTYNNGGNLVIHVDGTTGTSRRGALLKWDVSSIPTDATVSSAGIMVNVTDASPLVFNLYNMRRTWVEGTSSQAASSTSANWNTYNGSTSWGTVGAANTSSDRYDTNLWGATTSSFSSTGSKTVALNTDGVGVVQGWISGSTSNYGLTMQNYSGSTSNSVYFDSSEATTAANRPILNVTYCASTTTPTIITTGTLSAFSTTPGVASAAQTYTVAGSNLTSDIVMSPPTGFELSTNGSTYSSSLTLTQSGGTVASTTIYVRLTGTEGTFSGNITHTSSGATTKNVAVSGTASSCSTVNLTAVEDTYLSANDVTYNNGGNTELHVDATTGTSRRTTLLKWDVSSIPTDATVSSADIMVNVTDASPLVFNLYNMRRAWVEGTSTRAASSTSANWNTYNGSTSWGTVGAANTSSDRYDTNLWEASTNSFSSTGSKTEALNTDGVGVVQGWISGSTSNYGLTMQNYSGSTSNAVYFSSSEVTTAADRPMLNVTYCASTTTPTITTTGTLSAFTTTPGVASAAQTYTVAGSNLTSNIVITPPTGFELSTNGSTYSSSLTLTQSGGTVASTTIYVRLTGTEGTFSGNITHTSSGATTKNVAVSGTVLYVYTLTVGNDGHGTVTLNPSGGSYNNGATVTLTPVPNSGYVFSIWSGTNAADPSDNGNGTWSLIMNGNKSLTANFTLSTANVAPNQPVLMQPTDNATGVSTSPTLQVTASDPNASDTLSVSFYGRANGATAGPDFTLVAIPDAQNYATSYPSVYTNHLKWIADNKTTSNIVFATALGDLVNTSSSSSEYTNADTAFYTLDAGNVAYSVGPGNHDMAMGTTLWSSYFGTSRFSGKNYYGGSYDNYNNYYLFSASGMDFILINLQYSPTTAILDWADALLKANPSRRGIVEQHDILNTNDSWVNQASYTALKDNPNLFLMLCGHMHTGSDGAAYRAELGDDGHTIHIVMADYQDFAGSGYLRILRFSPADDMIYMTTSSPISGFAPITSDPNQKNLVYDMVGGSSVAYTLIGTVNNVANGANASLSWPGRLNNTEYEWYATVSDGSLTTTGSTWSFTTGTTTTNQPPVVTDIPNQTVAEGASFATINLDNYVSDVDNTDAEMTWTYSGNSALTVNIASRVAMITIPNVDWNGTETITFRATDPGLLYDDDAATFTVTAVNDSPVAVDDAYTTIEDTALVRTSAQLVANDTDVEGSALNVTAVSNPTNGMVSLVSGTITFTPTANFNGTAGFDYIVSDGGLTDTGHVTVTVTAINDAPVITGQAILSTNEDTPLTITVGNLTVTDMDNTYPTGFSLTVSTGTNYTVSGETITPAANFNGTLTVPVYVNDGSANSNTYNLTVTAVAVNDAPVAIAQTLSTAKDTALSIALTGLDVDSDPLTYSIATNPTHGTLSGSAPTVTYTPTSGYTGSDSFTFTVYDGAITSMPATVSIEVSEGSVPPIPSSFYGEIHFNDSPPITGELVKAYIDGVTGTAATVAIQGTTTLTYAFNIPGDLAGTTVKEGGVEGDLITFKIGDRVAATADWHSGTNVHLDFHPPQALPGGPYSGTAGAGIDFSGSASDYGSDISTYQWDWENDGTYDTTGQTASHSWANAGSFTVGLKVTDAQGGVGTVTVPVTVILSTHSISLVQGWNLVSFNVHPTNTNITAVLSSISGNYNLVYVWDATITSDNWKKYAPPPAPSYQNTLSSLDETMGFWIYMTVADTLDVVGTTPTTTDIAILDNAGGWNLVAYPSMADRSLPAALSDHGVGIDFSLVYAYYAYDTEDQWKLFDRTGATYANDLKQLTPGWGCWIKVNTDHTWNVKYLAD